MESTRKRWPSWAVALLAGFAVEGALLLPWIAMSLLLEGKLAGGWISYLLYLPQMPGLLILGGDPRSYPRGASLLALYLIQSGVYALVIRVMMVFLRRLFTSPLPTMDAGEQPGELEEKRNAEERA